jgi:hypothetical protein
VNSVQTAALLACLSCLRAASGQETAAYGSIAGRVADESGAVVEGAVVAARRIETNTRQQTITGAAGHFRFPYLHVGDYEVTVARPGFSVATATVALTVGAAFDLPLTLAVSGGATSVTVTAETAVLETARTQSGGTVHQAEVRDLPLNGRNVLDLALLVPGVSPTNTGSSQLFAETSAVPGQGISVGSQRNFSNSFVVDGLSANDDAAGLSGASFGLDAIQEFQVVTSGGHAELGRALGGYINMVTRSGGNQVRGDLYGYFRNQRLNAANPLSNTRLPLTQSQYGASLGGPLLRERTFYFANFEQRLLNQSGLVTIAPAAVGAINTRLAAVGYGGPAIATGLDPNPVHTANLLAKLDHRFGTRDQFSLRYSLYDVASRNSRGAGGLNAVTASAGLDDRDQTVAAGNVLTLSPNTVLETRGQVTVSHLEALPTDPFGPAVSIAGVATFGTMSGAPTARANRLYQVVNNLSHHSGAHAWRAGADLLFNDTDITYPRSVRGSYAFSTLANFLAGSYNNLGFTQTFGESAVSQKNPNLGLYAQDEWKINSRLTFNLGVRYDLQWLESIGADSNNVSPRAGFAWSPFASRSAVLRGSFGLFYDRVPLRALANALLSAGNTTDLDRLRQVAVSLSPAQAGAPVFPNILPAAVPLVTLPNLTTMDPGLQSAYSHQTNLEYEQRLGSRRSLAVGYQRLRGLHLIASINRNVPACAAAGNNNACRPNTAYANNSQYSAAADSHYDALHVSLIERPSKWGYYRVSYSWSKSLNNVGENFFSSPLDPTNIWLDYGRSDDDQRHRVVVDGALRTLAGFQLSGSLQYYSALPLNITSGVTTIQGTPGRPIVNGAFIPRNAGQGNDFWTVNTRLSRSFRLSESVRLETLAEAFNLLNHRNNLTRNGNFGPGAFPTNPSPTFGQITAVHDPRSLQLALRFRF